MIASWRITVGLRYAHLQHIFYFLFDVQTALQQTLIATVRNYIWGGVENK